MLFDSYFGLVIAPNKKLQEQTEIASIHDECSSVVFLFNHAALIFGVIVESCKSNGDTHDHLRNLKASNDNWIEPLRTELHGHQKVVAVHGCMDTVVHDHKENSWRGCCHIRMPAIKQDSNVVIPVKENKRFLVNDNEESINEFTENKIRNEMNSGSEKVNSFSKQQQSASTHGNLLKINN